MSAVKKDEYRWPLYTTCMRSGDRFDGSSWETVPRYTEPSFRLHIKGPQLKYRPSEALDRERPGEILEGTVKPPLAGGQGLWQ